VDTLAAAVTSLGGTVAAAEASISALSAEVLVVDKFSKASVADLLEATTTLGSKWSGLLASAEAKLDLELVALQSQFAQLKLEVLAFRQGTSWTVVLLLLDLRL
jgi:hypothetical protein